MHACVSALMFAAGAIVAQGAAAFTTSAYTDFDPNRNCTIVDQAGENDGDWIDFLCTGWKGYPVYLSYSDLRESLFYGFPGAGKPEPAWETFGSFNESASPVEWRLDDSEGELKPFATIHRRFVANPDPDKPDIQVLVVSRVGQPRTGNGCAVGLIVASGNAAANVEAREVADRFARAFACGKDSIVIRQKAVPAPDFYSGY